MIEIKIKASPSHCLFEKFMGPAKASGKINSGNLISIIACHSVLSSLHNPESKGRKNNKLIPHKRGDEKKSRKCCLGEGCQKETKVNATTLIESSAREKNNAPIIIIISIKMMRLLLPIIIGTFCNFPCIHL